MSLSSCTTLSRHCSATVYFEHVIKDEMQYKVKQDDARMISDPKSWWLLKTQNFVLIRKKTSDGVDANDDEWSDSLHLEEPVEEASEKGYDLESRMELISTDQGERFKNT